MFHVPAHKFVSVPVSGPASVPPPPASWKVEVIADSSGKWCGNAARYASEEAAKAGGQDLPSDGKPNYAISIQRAINSGMWSLRGSYGLAMMQAIEDGQAMLGPNSARDYWGNFIPSRSQVQAGTKGSREFVVEAMGENWALMLEAA